MDFSLSSILGGLIFSTIGLVIYRMGKKNSEMTPILIGIALMMYPMFVEDHRVLWGAGVALSAWGYYEVRGKYQ